MKAFGYRTVSQTRLVQVFTQERDVVLSALVGSLADHRGVGGLDDRNQQLGVDLSGAEVGVPVRTRTRGVPRVVAVHQVDAAGDAHDPLDGVDELLARSPGMAGVEAESDALVADVVPQAGDGVEMPGHRMVAARGVLQIDGYVGLEVLQRLAPAVVAGLPIVVVGMTAMDDHRSRVDLRGRVAGVL